MRVQLGVFALLFVIATALADEELLSLTVIVNGGEHGAGQLFGS